MEPKPSYQVEDKAKAEDASTSISALALSALPAAEIADRWWLAFTPDHEPTAAAGRFIERTGAPPTYLVKTPTMLLVGPLPQPRPRVEPPPEPEPVAKPQPARKSLKERIGPQLSLL